MDWFEHLADVKRQRLAANTWRTLPGAPAGCVSFASNDYLGLARHPEVIAAGQKALAEYGAGSRASALICGHLPIHDELEAALCAFKGSAAALLFPSGFQAALATLNALCDEQTTVILDRLAHASLIDGARAAPGRWRTFAHNDVAYLRGTLEEERGRRCLVVVESLYSMDGDTAPLAEIVSLTHETAALLLVDEAHATGVLGPTGRGLLEAFAPLPRHIIAMGTLSKALGAQGGFICACREIVDAAVHGRAHMFSTALAPAAAGAALAALNFAATDARPRERVLKLAADFRRDLATLGLSTPSTEGPIVPVLVGDELKTLEWSHRLRAAGLHVPAVRYPTVKLGAARLRVSFSAAHTDEECRQLVAQLAALRVTR
jgi:8-amino-7-oxononanoate synthase